MSKCDEVMKLPIENVCMDTTLKKRWVVCRARELSREMKFGEAMRKAWREIKEKC